jgi:WhiB family redox-sensing transcriptional regulator
VSLVHALDLSRLPPDFWSWRLWAACRQSDGELFFSPDGERGSAKRRRERAAKAICNACPVREDCASYAIRNRERYGVWGGLSEHERELIWRDDANTTPPIPRAS